MPCGGRENFWKSEMSAAFVPWQQKRVCEKSRQFRILSQTLFCSALPDRLFICMRFLSALRRACPISVQQQQQCQQQRVNALWRAYLISTARKERGISHEHAVSMPYIRLLPFLQMAETKTSIRQIVCQCPTSGFSHFYWTQWKQPQPVMLCQCPTSGFSHFYYVQED